MSALQLKYFTQPEILQQIGHIRLPMCYELNWDRTLSGTGIVAI
jgi:hypothetical protein